jgi:hypothetical protein
VATGKYPFQLYFLFDPDSTVVGFTITNAISAITTNVASSNLVHGKVYSTEHYVIKVFVSDLR